jgi:hypothetical protein
MDVRDRVMLLHDGCKYTRNVADVLEGGRAGLRAN